MYVRRIFGEIGNFVEKLKITQMEVDISTECTFSSARFCMINDSLKLEYNIVIKQTHKTLHIK